MAKISEILFLTLGGLIVAGAIPQYGQSDSGAAPPPPPPPAYANTGASSPSYSQTVFAAAPASSFNAPAPSFFNSGSSSSGGGGGPLSVQCRASPDGSGKIRYDCSGVDKNAITLRTEHFLELDNPGGISQNLDIDIPNYNIDEFIKAAFKTLGPQEGAKINILLKKPDVTYNAEKDSPQAQQAGQPSVNVNYQPVQKVSVHYPTQKQYVQGQGGSSGSSSFGGSSGSSSFGGSSGSSSFGGSSGSSSFGGNSGSSFGGNSGSSYGGNSGSSNGGNSGSSFGGNYGSSSGGAGPAPGSAYSRPQRASGFR